MIIYHRTLNLRGNSGIVSCEEKPSPLDIVAFEPRKRISVLSLFNFKKFEVNQHFVPDKQLVREGYMRVNFICWIARARGRLQSSGKGY